MFWLPFPLGIFSTEEEQPNPNSRDFLSLVSKSYVMRVLFVFLLLALLVSCGGDTSIDVDIPEEPAKQKQETEENNSVQQMELVSYHSNETMFDQNTGIMLLKSTNQPVTGVVFENYTNGQKKYDRSYKGGLLDGVSRLWYENGQLWSEGVLKEDQLHGLVRSWFRDGGLEFERSYEMGRCVHGCK